MYPLLLIKKNLFYPLIISYCWRSCAYENQRNISWIVKWVWKKTNKLKNSNTHFQGFLSSPLPERFPLLTPSFNSNLHRVLPSLFVSKRKEATSCEQPRVRTAVICLWCSRWLARVHAATRHDREFIGSYVNYFNYYTTVKGWSEYKGSLFDAELCFHRPESLIAN